VPPPRTNLAITLTCPHLKLRATALTLKVVSQKLKGNFGALVEAHLTYHGGGRIPAADLAGTVAFKVNGRGNEAFGLDPRHGWALFAMPTVKGVRIVKATFTGNGLLAPTSATLRAL
jgi:hypothetical protein